MFYYPILIYDFKNGGKAAFSAAANLSKISLLCRLQGSWSWACWSQWTGSSWIKWALSQIQKGSRELQSDGLNLSWVCLGNSAHKELSHLDTERLGLLNCCLVVDALTVANVNSFCTQCELGPKLILNVWNLINNNSIFSGIIWQALYGTLPCTTNLNWWEFKLRDNLTDLISCMFTKN